MHSAQEAGAHLVRIGADGDAEGAGETKVGKLEHSAAVDEQVLGLEIPVEDAVGVAEGNALRKREGIGCQGTVPSQLMRGVANCERGAEDGV